jgi:hypothetical protein
LMCDRNFLFLTKQTMNRQFATIGLHEMIESIHFVSFSREIITLSHLII